MKTEILVKSSKLLSTHLSKLMLPFLVLLVMIGLMANLFPIPLLFLALGILVFAVVFFKPREIFFVVILLTPFNELLIDFQPRSQYSAWKDVLLLLLFVVWVFKGLRSRRIILPNSPVTFPLLAFVFFSITTSLISLPFVQALLGLKAVIFYSLLYFVTPSILQSKEQIRAILIALVFSITLIAIYNVGKYYQPYYIFASSFLDEGRIAYTGMARLHFSGSVYLLFYLLLPAFALAIMPSLFKAKWAKFWLQGAVVVAAAVLGMSGYRTLWVGLMTGLLFMVLFLPKRHVPGIIVGLVTVVSFCLSTVTHRILALLDSADLSRLRIDEWGLLLQTMAHNPLGTGVGSMSSLATSKWLSQPTNVSFTVQGGLTHNGFLQIGIETGFFGLGLFFWLMVSILVMGWRLFRSSTDLFLKRLSLGILGASIAFYVGNLTVPLVVSPYNMYFWFLLGLLATMWHHSGFSSGEAEQR